MALRVTEPLGYIEMHSLVDSAAAVLTDSGGIQEVTTALGVPCVTLREQTERPITIEEGTNRLAAWPLTWTQPFRIDCCARERLIEETADTMATSRRWSLSASSTVKQVVFMETKPFSKPEKEI